MSRYAMAQLAWVRALGLAMAIAGAAVACVGGAAAKRTTPMDPGPAFDRAERSRRMVGDEAAAPLGFDPERFSRANALARVARVLASSAERLSSDGDRVCTGSTPPPEYCHALEAKVAELRAMASKALAACRQVSAGMLTEVGGETLCARAPESARRVLVIRPVVP